MEGSNSTSATIAAVNNASVQEAVDVKVSFRNEIRRFQLDGVVSLASLRSKVRALFSIDERSPLDLLYRDDENDLVTMNLDDEMKYALRISKGLLRLEVRIQGEAPVANVQPEPSPARDGRCSKWEEKWEEKRWKKMGKHHHPHFGHHGHPGQFSPFFGPRHHGPHAHGPHAFHSASETEQFEGFGRGRGHFRRPEQEGFARPDVLERECKDKLKARHVKDITIPDGTVVLPGVPFIKTWRIRNAGTVDWPANTRLVFISHKGDHMGGSEFVPVEGIVKADTEVNLSVNQVAPNEPGDYSGFWRLATEDGKKFGQRFWVSIKVVAEGSSSESSGFEHVPAPTEYEKLMQQVLDMGYTDFPKRRIQHLLFKFGGNVQTVVEKLEKRRECKEKRGWRDGCERKKH